MKNPKAQHTKYVENRQKDWQKVSQVADAKSDVEHAANAIENAWKHIEKAVGKLNKLQSTITQEYEETK